MKKMMILLFILGLLWLVPKAITFIEVDKCLDAGGSFDYEKDECNYSLKL